MIPIRSSLDLVYIKYNAAVVNDMILSSLTESPTIKWSFGKSPDLYASAQLI